MTLTATSHAAVSVLFALIALTAWIGVYYFFHRRRARLTGQTPSVQWRWLLTIVGCAAVAWLLGLILNAR